MRENNSGVASSKQSALQATHLVTKPIEHGEMDVWRCPLPLPNALRWVNGYVMRGCGQVVVIDPGFQNEQTQEAWGHYLTQLQLNWSAVTDIVVTHYHPDHSGMAGWLQRKTDARVWMSRKTHEIMQRMWGTSDSKQLDEWSKVELPPKLLRLFRENGLDQQSEQEFAEHFYSFQALVSPQTPLDALNWLEPGEVVRLAGVKWDVILVEGHASGQVMLWHEPEGLLFCADHVLPDISPNITVLAEEDANPLATFLHDLKKVHALPVKMAFPGHRGVIREWSGRIDELLKHHAVRLAKIETLVREQAPIHAWQLVPQLYNRIESVQQARFAHAETIAHLWYLEEQGQITREIRNEIVYYC